MTAKEFMKSINLSAETLANYCAISVEEIEKLMEFPVGTIENDQLNDLIEQFLGYSDDEFKVDADDYRDF